MCYTLCSALSKKRSILYFPIVLLSFTIMLLLQVNRIQPAGLGGLELESSCLRIRARRGACKATRLALLSNSPDRQMVGGSCSNWA